MANASTDTAVRSKVRLRLQRKVAYTITAGIMALMGGLFSTAAFAAGVSSVAVLAMLFVMGAAGALMVLVLWYVMPLHEAEI